MFAVFAFLVATVAEPQMINGSIKAVDGSKIIVTTKDGTEKTVWAIGKTAPVLVDGKPSDYDVLKAGVKVSIQTDGDDAKKIRVIDGDAGGPSKIEDANSKPSDSRLAEIEENIAIAKANIKSPDSKTRAGAFEFLATAAKEKDAVSVILPIVRDAIERERDGKVLEKALKAIAKQGTSLAGLAKTIEPLLENGRIADVDCRIEAFEAMAAFGIYSQKMATILCRADCNCVSDKEPIKYLSLREPSALIAMGPASKESIDEVIRRMNQERSGIMVQQRRMLLMTLIAIDPSNPKVSGAVVERWRKDKSPETDKVLRYLESRIEELSQSSDETKAKAATRALRELQQTVKVASQGK